MKIAEKKDKRTRSQAGQSSSHTASDPWDEGQVWGMLLQNKSTAFRLSNLGLGETDSSRQSAEKPRSVVPYDVEDHAWVPT